MNIVLLTQQENILGNRYIVYNDKFLHLKNTLKVCLHQIISVGELNGLIGHAEVTQINDDSIELSADFNKKPPSPLPIKLILALPRPIMLKRILRDVSMMGVKEIFLINTNKVEKSFWQSNLLKDNDYEQYLIQGLEQCKDTIIPKVYIKNRFKPFVEDELPDIIRGTKPLLAHPGDFPTFPQGVEVPLTLAIGPEGGFSNYEVEKFEEVGFDVVQCGARILRMETAVVSLLSQHSSFLN